ncbi:hypothetical protein O6P43_030184 [Quillaja saponaria]|uniref:Uncharacterized protein n=1 Tax=Quillaja saponaria TaxID=32244 RepID=A0AAD7KNW8_QUISA|nr:hypothetical protein O6P43_034427 [Quillaja saponaria]KAJ7949899.1 hypothetical protein O6P43_030184 [Quillaja saponaria]
MQVAPEGTYAWVSRIVALTPSTPPSKGSSRVSRGGHWPPASPGWRLAQIRVHGGRRHDTRWLSFARGPSRVPSVVPGLLRPCCVARNTIEATPGQAGLPAEFKHINKRRKRNLQGFP